MKPRMEEPTAYCSSIYCSILSTRISKLIFIDSFHPFWFQSITQKRITNFHPGAGKIIIETTFSI